MSNRVHIGEVIVGGLVFDLKRSALARSLQVEELLAAVPSLFKLLQEREVEYLLVGGIAMLAYVEGRNTQDIDLIMSADDLQRMPELVVEDRKPPFARANYRQLQVDLLLSEAPLFAHVLSRHAVEQVFLEHTIRCASVEGLLLLKLFALPSLYRQEKFSRVELYERDITMLLRDYGPDLAAVYRELAPYLSATDMSEVQSIVSEMAARIAKSSQRFREQE